MKKIMSLALLFALVLAFNGVAFGWGSGDGSNYGQLQETAVFYNNSGAKLVHGQAVILDTSATAATTLGAYVTTVAASADSKLVVGVVKEPAAIASPVIVVTRGPIDTLMQDSSEAVTTGTAVGTAGSGTAGCVGAGAGLGVSLEAGSATDGEYDYIWVQPTGSGI